MLVSVVAWALLGQSSNLITRDSYGVPHIKAATTSAAWKAAGYAVAQDRLLQMELSRRLARGRMAELLGPQYVGSDKEVLQTQYTDDELRSQVGHLSPALQEAYAQYADGVNEYIAEGHEIEVGGKQVKPEPWTIVDEAAIGVRLLQYFGRGGAGEIRNMAVLGYLQARPAVKGHVLDVLDDVLWQNDPSSPTTVLPEDESPNRPTLPTLTRATTERHLALLPKLTLFDLLPGLSLAQREKSTLLAEKVGAPFKVGSYCMVTNGKRSATGLPALLSGPQMGFSDPSVVHEMSIEAPGLNVVGMDVPGSPAIVVGHTRHIAWGITSGVADTDDIVFYPKSGDGYSYGGQARPLESHALPLRVIGGPDQTVVQNRTVDGMVVLSTQPHGSNPGYVFARKTSYWMKELDSLEAIASLWAATNAREADAAAAKGTMSFNVFYETDHGDIGYRYAGLVPLRSSDLDPRFPTPGDPRYAWRGMIPTEQMPHVINPKGGLITNWNNKPVSWWPNLDTPVWGRIFRVDAIRRCLDKPKLDAQDFELAAWTIARTDETWPFFAPYVNRAIEQLQDINAHPGWSIDSGYAAFGISGFAGRLMDGSRQALVYKAFIDSLRKAIFLPSVGNFTSDQLFSTAVQPSIILAALEHRTKFDFLHGRNPDEIVRQSLIDAYHHVASQPGASPFYKAPAINVPGETPIPYSNRGTYIQVVEMTPDGPLGRNVLPPGVAQTGPHSRDQVPLSRAWVYKPMHRPW